MSSVIVDDAMVARLQGILVPVEIRDPDGKLLGHYTPAVSPEMETEYRRIAALFDLDEAERILATERDQGRPLKEILEELQRMETNG